jgi:hypothetical protein
MNQHQKLQIKQVLANPDQFKLLVEIVPELRTIYLRTNSRRIAENVAFGDWGLPVWYYHQKNRTRLRIIDSPERLYGCEPSVLWECYNSWHCREHYTIPTVARERGFTIKQDSEFLEWLLAHMQNLANPVPSESQLSLERLLHNLRNLNETRTRH